MGSLPLLGMCEHVIDLTPTQRKEAAYLESTAKTVIKHLRKRFPFEHAWRSLEKAWNGQVLVGSTPYAATFDTHSGCLTIGIPSKNEDRPRLITTLLLGLSKGGSGGKSCSHLHDTIMREVSDELKIPFTMTCNDIIEHGMLDASWASNAACHTQRISWPELLGANVDAVAAAFKKAGRRVELATWDTMYAKPAAPRVIRVVYDPKTRMVVSPVPHVGTLPLPTNDDECFIQPDEISKAKCIGAPLFYPPKEWSNFIGQYFTEVVDVLRMKYPHATIEALPATASVSSDVRRDRIRVRFDPDSARVSSIPMVG